jgi:hypothetical protein
LIHGHTDQIYHELGMRASVFIELVKELRATGMTDSRHVMTEDGGELESTSQVQEVW